MVRAAVRLTLVTLAFCGWFGQGACASAHRFSPQGKLDLALPYCGIKGDVTTVRTPSPVIKNWLADARKRELRLPAAPLGSATCGDIELGTAGAREVARLARAPGGIVPESELETFHRSFGLPLAQAKSVVKAYYRARFVVDYGFDIADVSFGSGQSMKTNRGPPPLLEIHVRTEGASVQVLKWLGGIVRKVRKYKREDAPPDYLRTCMPDSEKWIPGEVVGLLIADSDGLYRLWLTGEGHHIVAAQPGGPGRGNLQSSRSCQFVGADGHRFTGRMSWRYRAVTKQLRRNMPNPFGLTKQAYLVWVEINGGGGGYRTDIAISDAEQLNGRAPYLIDPQATLKDARQRFVNELAVRRATIRKRLAMLRQMRSTQSAKEIQARRTRLASAPAHYRPPLESVTVPRYGWDDKAQQLHIMFVHSRIAKWHDDFQLHWAPTGSAVQASGSPVQPPFDSARIDLSFGVELAALYIYDATGTLRDVRIGPTHSLPSRFISSRKHLVR